MVRIITGTPTASPAAPALPTTAIALGRINVPNANGGPASVVDERLFTATQGGMIFVPDAAARLRLGNPTAGNAYYVHEMSTAILWCNSGAGWRQVFPTTDVVADTGTYIADASGVAVVPYGQTFASVTSVVCTSAFQLGTPIIFDVVVRGTATFTVKLRTPAGGPIPGNFALSWIAAGRLA